MKNQVQSFIKISLVSTVASIMGANATAATEQQQIQQLRQEVAALKSLIQQQQHIQVQQQQQINQVAKQPVAETVKQEGLKLTTANGAEFKLYGSVRADANYIVEGADNDFNSVATSTGASKDKLRSTLKTTRIGVDFSTPLENGKLGAKVETDFASSSDNLRIRHAYLTYNDWLIGQTTSTFYLIMRQK